MSAVLGAGEDSGALGMDVLSGVPWRVFGAVTREREMTFMQALSLLPFLLVLAFALWVIWTSW